MSEFWSVLLQEALDGATLWAALLVVVTIAGARWGRSDRRGTRVLRGVFLAHVASVFAAAMARSAGWHVVEETHLGVKLGFGWVVLLSIATLLFEVVLPRVRMPIARIGEDLFVAVVGTVMTFVVASRSGFNLQGLIATSAVVTAVIGLSLQDTLGNTLGGLALQLDDSVHVGDWIKIGDVTGRVVQIRWRFTAIETRNWETVLIPNSKLVKEQVTILGKREQQPRQWRRWVYFNVDYRTAPSEVISVVESALRGAPLPNVADTPPPNCICVDFGDSVARYAVRYWLTDLAVDDPTDSAVRQRLYFALKRANIPVAIPAQALFLTDDSATRRTRKDEDQRRRRVQALGKVELFKALSDDDRAHLAHSLVYAPFARGEILTRQGAQAHWLYCIEQGRVSVRVEAGDDEREVAQMGDGEVFGEMSLLTGAPRSASVHALTDVECWRLDKESFRAVLQQKPEIAGPIASMLAARQTELVAAREGLDAEAKARHLAEQEHDLLQRMRRFFGVA